MRSTDTTSGGIGSHRWRFALSGLGIAAICGLWPQYAHANGGEGAGTGETGVVLALILAVATAYLLTHFVVERLQKRFLVLTGVEYVLLGVLLGPELPLTIPAFSNLSHLLPIVALAVGWIGLLRGMELSVRRHRGHGGTGNLKLVVVQALVAGGLTSTAAYFAFSSPYFFGTAMPIEGGPEGLVTAASVSSREIWMSALVMGCAAAAGSVDPIELLQRRYRLDGVLPRRLRPMAGMSDLLAILVFGLLFSIFHTVDENALVQPSPTEWAVVSLLLGGLLGILFTPFLGDDDSANGQFLALVGIITLASGAAYFLDLSPLLVNLCLGVVLVNTSRSGAAIHQTLERTKRPMALVLMVFAGALWRPPDPWLALIVAAAYVPLRLLGKAIGTRLAVWGTGQRHDLYRGLIAHREVSVAMAISFRLVYEGQAVDLAYTAILISVVVSDFFAPRILRGLLVDTGDIGGEQDPDSKVEGSKESDSIDSTSDQRPSVSASLAPTSVGPATEES